MQMLNCMHNILYVLYAEHVLCTLLCLQPPSAVREITPEGGQDGCAQVEVILGLGLASQLQNSPPWSEFLRMPDGQAVVFAETVSQMTHVSLYMSYHVVSLTIDWAVTYITYVLLLHDCIYVHNYWALSCTVHLIVYLSLDGSLANSVSCS